MLYGGKDCQALFNPGRDDPRGELVDLPHSEISSFEDESVGTRAAAQAEEGEFERRDKTEHLESPRHQDAQLKYADVLLKGVKNVSRQDQATKIYDNLLSRSPGRADIRRRLAELNVEMGRYGPARPNLDYLLKAEPTDGKLHFLLGRCLEALDDAAKAEASYQAAIANGAPQRFEAYQRRASLLKPTQQTRGGRSAH
jgi:tetratricopeptide (TPR) repeat protein